MHPESTAGDPWVDTGNQQLYLFTGSGWILVGPEFSTGLSSGTQVLTIAGTDGETHSIVKIQVAGKVIARYYCFRILINHIKYCRI